MKLSDFKDEKAIEVVAKLMEPIGHIAANTENAKAKEKNGLEFVSALLRSNKKDVMSMLAILDDKDPAEYHCNAASVVKDIINMLNDPELMELFGVQSMIPASSGSALENIEALTA